jgi:hypothetical protein
VPQAARLALGILVGFWNWELFPRRVFGVGNWLRAGPMGTIVVLDLMGGVALLLWGLHMVRSGVLRAFGPDLRRFLSKALGNRFAAFAAGLGLTALLQSSTATGLMAALRRKDWLGWCLPWPSCSAPMSGRP